MRRFYLPEKGFAYKANLHCHSVLSDGFLTPEALKKAYKEHGYSILAITDHEGIFDHSDLNDDDFLALPGYEREINAPEAGDRGWNSVVTCHLCFYPKAPHNISCTSFNPDFVHPKFRWMHQPELKKKVTWIGEPYVPEYTVESVNHVIEQANRDGFLVTLNHLRWSQEPYEQFIQYKGLFAMEIYNTASERSGHDEYNGYLYDQMLRSGSRLHCVAADDNHNRYPPGDERSDSFGGFVVIKAGRLTHEAVISALENGAFYSSTGPFIEALYEEDGMICIHTSPAKKIRIVSGDRGSALAMAPPGKTITSARFDAAEFYRYFRIEVTDGQGEKAYSNAYYDF